MLFVYIFLFNANIVNERPREWLNPPYILCKLPVFFWMGLNQRLFFSLPLPLPPSFFDVSMNTGHIEYKKKNTWIDFECSEYAFGITKQRSTRDITYVFLLYFPFGRFLLFNFPFFCVVSLLFWIFYSFNSGFGRNAAVPVQNGKCLVDHEKEYPGIFGSYFFESDFKISL